MKVIITLLACILLMSTMVSAHTLERKVIVRSDGTYNVQFSSEPEYPVTGQKVHFDFVIWDNDGKTLTNLDILIEMQKEGALFRTSAVETEPGHYSVEYKAKEFGVYRLSPIINGERVDIAFAVYLDTFGAKGFATVGVIVLFLLILLMFMYKDCKKKKSREERVEKKKRGLKK